MLLLLCRNEFLAVRNTDGGFFLCQTMYNVYKSSPKIRIRWLSEGATEKNIYCLDYMDTTDIECVLTSVSLNKLAKGKFELTNAEHERIENILKKALDVENGIVERPDVTEENPDGREFAQNFPFFSLCILNVRYFCVYFQWIFLCTRMNRKLRRKLLANVRPMLNQHRLPTNG